MKYGNIWRVTEAGAGRYLVEPEKGAVAQDAILVRQACRLTRLSQRHLYRLIRGGEIQAFGKFLGEWLLNREDVARIAQSQAQAQPLPRSFETFFPEYAPKSLNPGREATTILARLLEQGGQSQLRWIFKRYTKKEIKEFLKEDGARLLSPPCLNFWCLFLSVPISPAPDWRQQPWNYGGSV